MAIPQNKKLNTFARELRKNMTKEEHRLWYYCLRNCPVKFYRQRIVGKYILDFYSASAKMAIELDGSQHYDPQTQKEDVQRTNYINSLGIEVLRFSNADVMERFEGVCEAIYEKIKYAPQRKREIK